MKSCQSRIWKFRFNCHLTQSLRIGFLIDWSVFKSLATFLYISAKGILGVSQHCNDASAGGWLHPSSAAALTGIFKKIVHKLILLIFYYWHSQVPQMQQNLKRESETTSLSNKLISSDDFDLNWLTFKAEYFSGWFF